MILVTGHKGFIGSNLIKYFELNNTLVRGFEWGDKLDLSEITTVIHLGAISTTTEMDIDKVMRQNYDFSVDLLDKCVVKKIDFQYASSASVYGINTNKRFNEDDPVDPKTPYAWSKYMFERYANSLINQGVEIKIQGFRYFNVWGDWGEENKQQPSPYHTFKKQFLKNGKIILFENSHKYLRDFIHVDDIILLHNMFLSIPESGVWNFGTGNPKSFLDVALEVSKNNECVFKFVPMPDNLKQSYQSYTCADMTKTLGVIKSYEKNFGDGTPRFGKDLLFRKT